MATNIADWLKKLGMSAHVQCFAENDIDISVFRHLTDQDLKELGSRLGIGARCEQRSGSLSALRSTPVERALCTRLAERRQLTVNRTVRQPRSRGLAGIIGAYQRCCTQLVEHKGGFIAKYIGDGVLAYFGYLERMSMMPNSRCAPGSVLSTRFQSPSRMLAHAASASWYCDRGA